VNRDGGFGGCYDDGVSCAGEDLGEGFTDKFLEVICCGGVEDVRR